MGEAAGAALSDMQYMKILISGGGSVSSTQNAIYANEEGNRFVAEDAKTDVLADAFLEQTNDHAYMIYDSRAVGEVTEAVQGMITSGEMVVADTLDALAGQLNVDAQNLTRTVAEFNKVVSGQAEDAFGRSKFGDTIEQGPFYATERHVRMHYTMGGLKIDKDTHVLSTEDAIIPGLYAAGETTGGIHGNYRVGANALSEIFVMGRVAGHTAAVEALAK